MILLRLLIFSTFIFIFFPQKSILAFDYCKFEPNKTCFESSEKQQKINYWTSYFFSLLRPEIRQQTIKPRNLLYRRENAKIRQVVKKVVEQSCQLPQLNHYYLLTKSTEKGRKNRALNSGNYNRDRHNISDQDYYWERTEKYFFAGLYQDLTEAVFAARHPELSPQMSREKTITWSTEQIFIRQYFVDFEQEKILKESLIPICDRSIPLLNENQDN